MARRQLNVRETSQVVLQTGCKADHLPLLTFLLDLQLILQPGETIHLPQQHATSVLVPLLQSIVKASPVI